MISLSRLPFLYNSSARVACVGRNGKGLRSLSAKIQLDRQPGAIVFSWNSSAGPSSSSSTYHNIWLRDNCQCPKCLHQTTKQKLVDPKTLPLQVKPVDVAIDHQANTVEITWSGNDSHKSVYNLDWLRANDYSPQAFKEKRKREHQPVLWNADQLSKQDIWKSYEQFLDTSHSDRHLGEFIMNLHKYGIAFIKGVPLVEDELERVTARIGAIRETFYGRIWDLKSIPNAKNIAYTSLYLGFHMDLLYFESPPGIQFLHCLDSSVRGGDSIFCDSFNAAEILRREYPQHFETLTKVPVTFHYDNGGHHLRFRRLTIVDDDLNHGLQVNFAPQFMGPLEAPPDMVQKFYEAFSVFAEIISRPELQFELRLEPGDVAVFANRRTMHGRQAFDANSGGMRHLRGTYVDWDALLDRYRTFKAMQQQK